MWNIFFKLRLLDHARPFTIIFIYNAMKCIIKSKRKRNKEENSNSREKRCRSSEERKTKINHRKLDISLSILFCIFLYTTHINKTGQDRTGQLLFRRNEKKSSNRRYKIPLPLFFRFFCFVSSRQIYICESASPMGRR